jgi:hypothetical protein
VILPAKHLSRDRALVDIGAEVLAQLDETRTVSELWYRVRLGRSTRLSSDPLFFDWFILSLSFLYAISAISIVDGLISSKTTR